MNWMSWNFVRVSENPFQTDAAFFKAVNMPRLIQKMALTVLIFGEGYGFYICNAVLLLSIQWRSQFDIFLLKFNVG